MNERPYYLALALPLPFDLGRGLLVTLPEGSSSAGKG